MLFLPRLSVPSLHLFFELLHLWTLLMIFLLLKIAAAAWSRDLHVAIEAVAADTERIVASSVALLQNIFHWHRNCIAADVSILQWGWGHQVIQQLFAWVDHLSDGVIQIDDPWRAAAIKLARRLKGGGWVTVWPLTSYTSESKVAVARCTTRYSGFAVLLGLLQPPPTLISKTGEILKIHLWFPKI